MNIFTEILKVYGPALIYALVTLVAGLLARAIATVYNAHVNSAEKRAVAKTVVLAVEQIYQDLHGPEKFNKALDALRELLAEKGITITDLEARTLIEAAVGEFNNVFKENVEPLPTANNDE